MGSDLKLAASIGYFLLPTFGGGVTLSGVVLRYDSAIPEPERIPLVLRLLTGEARKKRIRLYE